MTDVQIGKSQVYVRSLGLGANAIGGHNLFPNLDEEEGKEIVRTALRNGINLIDTAYIYGEGRSEELIGDVFKKKRSIAIKSSLPLKQLIDQKNQTKR